MLVTGSIAVMSSAAGITVASFAYRVADAATGGSADPWAVILSGGGAGVLVGVLMLLVTGRLYTSSHVKYIEQQNRQQARIIAELYSRQSRLLLAVAQATVPALTQAFTTIGDPRAAAAEELRAAAEALSNLHEEG